MKSERNIKQERVDKYVIASIYGITPCAVVERAKRGENPASEAGGKSGTSMRNVRGPTCALRSWKYASQKKGTCGLLLA